MTGTAPRDLREALAELEDHLARLRFTGRSGDRLVSAVVDGQRTLLDIVVDDRALRGGFPEHIGRSVTQAVTAARQQAGEVSATLLGQTLAPEAEDLR